MDFLDQAQEVETLHREASLKAARTQPEKQLIINGVVLCKNCEEPIPHLRIAKVPTACRCIDCQEEYEKKERLWTY